MTDHFNKGKITHIERICMATLLALFFLSLVAGMPLLESFILLIGISIGIFSLYRITVVAKNDPENHDELNAWSWRFAIFKGVPLVIAIIAVFV
jgi:hypothetical protein